jgi:fatty-acyl-CoA synthase
LLTWLPSLYMLFLLLLSILLIVVLLVLCSTIDWKAFHRECSAHLPVYARPAFVRVTKAIALTSTFKHQKGDLVREGYDVTLPTLTDDVYFYSPKDGAVLKVTPALVQQIADGVVKL